MNERIRELADQLGPVATIGNWGRVEWSDNVYPQLGDKMYAAIDLEKFAELIVKECINEIAYIGKANEVFGDRTDRGGLNHILWTTETAIEKIKQHFGVGE
jgi:hypothetical protein